MGNIYILGAQIRYTYRLITKIAQSPCRGLNLENKTACCFLTREPLLKGRQCSIYFLMHDCAIVVNVFMLNVGFCDVAMLNVILLSVIMQCVIMLCDIVQ
jgi:hypothetical protein